MASRRRWTVVSWLITSVAAIAVPVLGQTPTGKAAVTPPMAPPTMQAALLDIGSVVSGTLGEGDLTWPEQRYYDIWNLAGRRNETVTVDLLSDEFDAVLYLVGSFQLTYDDDGAGGCSARIQITFPVDGTYRLLVSSYGRGEAGSYTIRVTNRPASPLDQACSREGGVPAGPAPTQNETCVAMVWMGWLALAAESGGGADFPALRARERSACELGLETPSGDRWPNGQTARLRDNWYYPNGQTARLGDNWYYPAGQTARLRDNWYYPNGQTALLRDNWYLPDGTGSSVSGVIEYALARLPAERGEELLAGYRAGASDVRTLMLIVMAGEASRERP